MQGYHSCPSIDRFLLILPVPGIPPGTPNGDSGALTPIHCRVVSGGVKGIGRGHLLGINYLVLNALAWELNPKKANPLWQPPPDL